MNLTHEQAHILAGGTGTLGRILQEHFTAQGDRVTVLTRSPQRHERADVTFLYWDGRTEGPWVRSLDRADAVINLAGRSVDCRYTAANRARILNSRVDATHVLGRAIARCTVPPPVWINMSSATVYRHAEDRPMDELSGELGTGLGPEVVLAWEKAFFAHRIAGVRQVAVRCAMVLSPKGGAFPRFVQLTRAGLGGAHGSGRQYVSWVHGADVARFCPWVIGTPGAEGIINLSAPEPVPEQQVFGRLRSHLRPWAACSTPEWLVHVGAFLLRTEAELVLKSRRVVPTRALGLGFRFHYPTLGEAMGQLFPPHHPQDHRP